MQHELFIGEYIATYIPPPRGGRWRRPVSERLVAISDEDAEALLRQKLAAAGTRSWDTATCAQAVSLVHAGENRAVPLPKDLLSDLEPLGTAD